MHTERREGEERERQKEREREERGRAPERNASAGTFVLEAMEREKERGGVWGRWRGRGTERGREE